MQSLTTAARTAAPTLAFSLDLLRDARISGFGYKSLQGLPATVDELPAHTYGANPRRKDIKVAKAKQIKELAALSHEDRANVEAVYAWIRS